MSETCDVLIAGGLVFDGLGAPPRRADVAIKGGAVTAIGEDLPHSAGRVVDAGGSWVTPGLIDLHTHYDVEVEAGPGLQESVRHGVSTVVFGNCSLSAALADKERILDLFCRVESLPRAVVSGWLDGRESWEGVAGYYEHLERLPIGPNVATLLGHSELRVAAMGWERAMTVSRATEDELSRMEALLEAALDAGFTGLSVDLLPWHRVEAGPFQGEPVPSHQAAWSEVARLAGALRRRGRLLQATPNAMSRMSVLFLLWLSLGLGFRRALRVTVVSAMDIVANRAIWWMQLLAARLVRALGGDFLWQVLVEPFLNFADGVNTPIFEELPAGVHAIGVPEEARAALFGDPEFRAAFRRDWTARGETMFHRDPARIRVVACPDGTLVGRSLAELAGDGDPLERFMDLLAEHGDALRWTTVIGNDRQAQRDRVVASPVTLPGFNDSGAHNRQMAFQCGGASLLAQVLARPALMSPEEAVHRLTGRTAAWLGLATGTLRVGDPADVAVFDVDALRRGVGEPVAIEDPRFGPLARMVRRTDGAVRATIIGGRVAFADGAFAPDLGAERYGRLLRVSRDARGG